jgi:excisionase family DNA binding protein
MQIIEKNKKARNDSIQIHTVDIDDVDRQKLITCFEVMARLIAKEVVKELDSPVKMPKIIAKEELKTNACSPGIVPPPKEKIVLSCSEVADLLGVSVRFVYQMVRQNKIPHVRIGDRILISRVALDKQLNNI